ncbi:MAG: hypothetical protein QM373_10460 [Bacillota bacterium]|jgi:xanthine/uracil permease|nr:hypothetical protein [Bacillota bacterium]
MMRTKRHMLIGGTMLVVGWVVIFAMVLEVIPSPIWLNMVAYAVTIFGFMLGMVGVMTHIRVNLQKHRDNDEDRY